MNNVKLEGKVLFIGKLEHFGPHDTPFVVFGVSNGDNHISCIARDKMAHYICDYVAVWDYISLTGHLESFKWANDDGTIVDYTRLAVEGVSEHTIY